MAVSEFAPMTTFLARLRELLRGKLDDETYRAVENIARGYAGGKAKAASAARQITQTIRATTEELPQEYVEAERAFYEAVLDYSNDVEPSFAQNARLEKADERVNFRQATEVGQTCGDCRFYTYGSCRMVEGSVTRSDYCDLFSERSLALSETGYPPARLFLETQEYAEAPDWMPLLPKSGSHKHPSYGTVSFTKERNANFINNFKNKVYQEQLPVDAEHQLKLSGAVGWIQELRQNTDGSVDARVEWTDRGNKLIKQGGYKYVSPEFLEKFIQPESGKEYKDVVIGAAITTRPFFKERSLRPLVASEQGFSIAGSDEKLTNEDDTDMPEETGTNTEQATDESAATDEKKFAEMQQENAELKAFREQAEQNQKQLTEQVEKLTTDAQHKRFTDEVLGRSNENGNRWHGETEKHIKVLTGLAKAFGEDSEEFKDFVTQQRELSIKLNDSPLFKEQGSNTTGNTGSAISQLNEKAKALVEAGKAETFAQAFAEVVESNKDLAQRYYEEGN